MIFVPLARVALMVVGAGAVSVLVDRQLKSRKEGVAEGAGDDAGKTSATQTLVGMADRSWNEVKDLAERSADFATGIADRSWGEVKGLSDRVLHKTPSDFPPRFRDWATKAASADAGVSDWLNALPEAGLHAFTEHLAAFCSDMGFELSWLVEPQFEQHPELARAAERIVLHYCGACQQGAAAQEDLDVYKQLLAFERDPYSRKNRPFVEGLFGKVAEEGLVAANMSEYFLAASKERQQLAVATIRQAAAKDHVAFNRAVKEVLSLTKASVR